MKFYWRKRIEMSGGGGEAVICARPIMPTASSFFDIEQKPDFAVRGLTELRQGPPRVYYCFVAFQLVVKE